MSDSPDNLTRTQELLRDWRPGHSTGYVDAIKDKWVCTTCGRMVSAKYKCIHSHDWTMHNPNSKYQMRRRAEMSCYWRGCRFATKDEEAFVQHYQDEHEFTGDDSILRRLFNKKMGKHRKKLPADITGYKPKDRAGLQAPDTSSEPGSSGMASGMASGSASVSSVEAHSGSSVEARSGSVAEARSSAQASGSSSGALAVSGTTTPFAQDAIASATRDGHEGIKTERIRGPYNNPRHNPRFRYDPEDSSRSYEIPEDDHASAKEQEDDFDYSDLLPESKTKAATLASLPYRDIRASDACNPS